MPANKSSVTAPRRVAAQESFGAALLPLVALVLLVIAACKQDSEPAMVPPVPVVPLSTLIPLTGGAEIPDASRMLLATADQDLRAGNFDAAAQAARRAREGANGPRRCVAEALQGIADVNRGQTEAALQELHQGECAIPAAPTEVRKELATTVLQRRECRFRHDRCQRAS